MSEKILKNKEYLQLLCNSNKKLKKALIESGSKDQIHCLCEVVLNLLKGNIDIKENDYKKLYKKRKLLRELIKKGPIKHKKYLIQKGGFIQFLIPAIISGLATIVSSIIEKV